MYTSTWVCLRPQHYRGPPAACAKAPRRENRINLGLNNFITPRDVAAMMVLLKISRLHGDGPKDVDTYVDICGYAAIGGEIASSD